VAVALAQKLGIKPGHHVALLGAQPLDSALISPLPLGAVLVDPGAVLAPEPPDCLLDVVVYLTNEAADLAAHFAALKARLAWEGGLWIGWPKRASKRPTDLTFEIVQPMGLALGLVDNKVCAIDDTWTGLRFVYRKADRPPTRGRAR